MKNIHVSTLSVDTDKQSQTVDRHDKLIGVIICKLEKHRDATLRGYIAMLAVVDEYRGRGIATRLVRMAVDAMIGKDADEVSCPFEFTSPC